MKPHVNPAVDTRIPAVARNVTWFALNQIVKILFWAFLGLKILGVVDWSWVIVTCPIWSLFITAFIEGFLRTFGSRRKDLDNKGKVSQVENERKE